MADTKVSAFPAAALPLAGTDEVPVIQSGAHKKTTVADLRDAVQPAVVSTQVNNSNSTTATAALQLTLPVGTYNIKAWLVWQAAATTTGIEFWLNMNTGAVSRCAATWYTLTTGGAAATGVADQATTLTAQMIEGKGQRASNAASGPIQGVDTATADQFSVLEGIVVVTTAGVLQLMMRTEVNASQVSLMPGSNIEARKVA